MLITIRETKIKYTCICMILSLLVYKLFISICFTYFSIPHRADLSINNLSTYIFAK